jgi:hypothetical protein
MYSPYKLKKASKCSSKKIQIFYPGVDNPPKDTNGLKTISPQTRAAKAV